MTTALRPFHLAIAVNDLAKAETFYCGLIGCGKGRTSDRWTDLDFFGHQVTLHLTNEENFRPPTNPVDGDKVPARHFGMVLDMDDWRALADRLQEKSCEFLITPRIRY